MDIESATGFDWDAGNLHKNTKHGVSAANAEEVFFSWPLVVPDPRHSQGEARFHALARIGDGQVLHVAFTLRERSGQTLIRVISARPASRTERSVYDQQTKV